MDNIAPIEIEPLEKAYPWRRYFARTFDAMLLGLFVWVVLTVLLIAPIVITYAVLHPGVNLLDQLQTFKTVRSMSLDYLITLFLLIPTLLVEGVMVKYWGTTPGKALFGIQLLTKDHRHLPFKEAIARPFRVFFYGQGAVIPGLSFFTYIYAYKYLSKHRTAYWDKGRDIAYSYTPISSFRELAGGAATVGLFVVYLAFR